MKSLKVIIILSSLLLFSPAIASEKVPNETNGAFESMPIPFFIDNEAMSLPAFLWRSTQYMRFRLNKDEKKMHQSAVFFMLENAPNGEVVSWYSDERLANGKVRVIHSYEISGGYCRTYQAYIKLNGSERHMTKNACKYIGSPSWSFYK